MNSLVLHRMQFAPISETHAHVAEIAEKLATDLGFSANREKLEYDQIAAKLASIGCIPFSTRSVQWYKGWQEFRAKGILKALITTFISIAWLAGCIIYWTRPYAIAVIAVPSIFSFFFWTTAVLWVWDGPMSTTVTWQRERLDSYEGTIPLEAAQKALQIKSHFPNVGFSVEELRISRKRVIRGDPFLLALINGYLFYIAVWDEPGFVARIRTR